MQSDENNLDRLVAMPYRRSVTIWPNSLPDTLSGCEIFHKVCGLYFRYSYFCLLVNFQVYGAGLWFITVRQLLLLNFYSSITNEQIYIAHPTPWGLGWVLNICLYLPMYTVDSTQSTADNILYTTHSVQYTISTTAHLVIYFTSSGTHVYFILYTIYFIHYKIYNI